MTPSVGFRLGAREALGTPAAVLAAGFVGYGALAADGDFPVWLTLVSTMAIWALPGQLIMLEMTGSAAPALAILVAVSVSAVRFLPMTVSLMPVLRTGQRSGAPEFLAAHLLSMTGWVAAMRRTPELVEPARLPYFLGFALALWCGSIVATGLGYLVADALPPLSKAGFVFLSPVYFLLMLVSDARNRMMVLSLGLGAALGPLIYLASPQWSVVAAGLVGGTIAFLVHRAAGRP
ncbi:MAG: AzlC family ABC transporter permease [Burkholderiales bacterium]|nr:MAG: AzlC family ABC transporter permease [Burkholderiales bacterium]